MSEDAKRHDQGLTQLAAFFALLLSMTSLLAVALKLNDNGEQAASAANGSMNGGMLGPATGGGGTATAAESVKLVIKSDEEHGKQDPAGTWHDAYLPADFSVKAGATVRVTVYNYDDMPHTFTAMGLGTNVEIAAGSENKPSRTTFTFHAPQKAGSYEWFCALPCDPWAMTHFGFMKGHVTVT
ncbi:MAG TPA: cupredoxin domain-containing protein [Solirubrobacterales bacterium]|nr:cupredoxin domain-containing protein [Solirubrobacterales bacterium]